jgi:ribulose-phosphate 3-epimerase
MADVTIIPTVVPSTLKDIETAQVHYGEFAPSIHIDCADGIFAPNLTWMPHRGEMLPAHETVFYEAHLMAHDPREVGTTFAHAGGKRIFGHVEAFSNPSEARHAFEEWKAAGAQETGIAVLIETPIADLDPYIDICDEILLMTIATIGQQGGPFDERGVGRVSELHAQHPFVTIGVDGGVSEINIKQLAHAGASRFCVGTALASVAERRAETYVRLKSLAQSAIQ